MCNVFSGSQGFSVVLYIFFNTFEVFSESLGTFLDSRANAERERLKIIIIIYLTIYPPALLLQLITHFSNLCKFIMIVCCFQIID